MEAASGEQLAPKLINSTNPASFFICTCGGEEVGWCHTHTSCLQLTFAPLINPEPSQTEQCLGFLVSSFSIFQSNTLISSDRPSPVWRSLCPPWHPGCLAGCMRVSSGCRCCCCCCLCWRVLTQLCPPRCPRWESGRCLTAETGRHLRASRQSHHSNFNFIYYQSHLFNRAFF